LRLEHRFIHKNINTDETQNWFRYDLNVNYPINENWSASIFNEIFLNLDGSEFFAQNWTGASFLRKINKKLKVKFGSFQIKQNSRTLKRIRVSLLLNTAFF
jgi:hypothetical protein